VDYAAFLRAVNVGGRNPLSMKQLVAMLQDLGFDDVRTHINSGNIIFGAPRADRRELAQRIERAIEQHTAMPVMALVLTRSDLKKLVEAIPKAWMNDTQMRCDVLLLWADVDKRSVLDQLPINPDIEDVIYVPGAVIWRVDRAHATRSRLTKIVGTPLYKQLTIRNVNTIRKLHELAAR